MALLLLFILACSAFGLAYWKYGAFLDRTLGVNPDLPTPAHTHGDGVDYVPARAAVLFGHHFSSIAGAGPIVGPVIAALAFGWAPALAWIVIGAIFVGGVHDFTAIMASTRNEGQTIGQICRARTGPFAYHAMLVFVLMTLVYVIIVFLDLTAASFAPSVRGITDPAAAGRALRQGGAVATASFAYIALAIIFGLLLYRSKWPLRKLSLIFVPFVFGVVVLGLYLPLHADLVPALMGNPKHFWSLVLLIYAFLASVLPVWILLQPRDYLSSFLLYACLGGGAMGLIMTAFTGGAAIEYPAWIGWRDPRLGLIFPALFVTIACGAVSGFHSMVASGTSSKQLDNEASARPVAYGAMLIEAVLAMLAVSTVMLLPKATGQTPVQTFAAGLGHFLSHLGLPATAAETFAMLAISTFLLTTLDTCTRMARMVFQELCGLTTKPATRFAATLAVLALPAWMVFQEIPGPGGNPIPAWNAIWPAFGATNQLLAALSLLIVTAWLRAAGRKHLFAAIPAAFMCVTTLAALADLTRRHLFGKGSLFVGYASLVLALLAILVIVSLLRSMLRPRTATRAKREY
jgi:carbon starvation protein